jgi:hypothetical protein
VVARDARSGKVRWRSDQEVTAVAADYVAVGEGLHLAQARRLGDGKVLASAPGLACGGLDDRLFVQTDDGVVAVPLDGRAPEVLASSALLQPFGDGLMACGVRGDDLIMVFYFEHVHDMVFVRVHDRAVAATDRVLELDWPFHYKGWDRPLPRYVPLIGYGMSSVGTIDLDEMQEHARTSFPPGGTAIDVRARQGDRFLLSDNERLFALEGERGTFVASDKAYGPTDLDGRAVTGRTIWAAVRPGPIEAAVLGDDGELARTLNAGR